MITIDGHVWDVPCDLERTADITPSEISGMLLDKTYFNDVLGTFMTYDVTLAVPPTMMQEYSNLYESLTDPVDAHAFVLPYNNGMINLTARVEQVRDIYVYTVSQRQYWRGMRFTVIASHPSKEMSLGEVLTIGRTPFPEEIGIETGAIYEKTEDGWQELDLSNGDEVRY